MNQFSSSQTFARACTGMILIVALLQVAAAESPALTCAEIERIALADHPILAEQSLNVDKAQEKVRDLDMGVILPRFEIETGMGPAPGIRQVTKGTWTSHAGDTLYQTERRFDFSEWGPFFGIQARVAQPLNIARYRAGRRAASLNVRVSEAEFKKQQLDVSEEAQTICHQRLFALTMRRELESARKDLDRAQQKLSDRLDEGDEDVSQTDVLQLKAGRYSLDQGVNEALLGVNRTGLALRFLLARPDEDSAGGDLTDSVLTLRPEVLPPLDSLKFAALRDHPDLARLRNGLAARQELLKVAQGGIGPDIFLFGSFEYSKAWSSDRQSGGGDPFARDPLNELTGIAGLGMRLRLNFWDSYQSYRRERLSLRQLERTEVYAARGVVLRVEDAYLKVLKARADAEAAQNALRAAEAWLKGAAMRYDLDPSEAQGLTAPFRQSIVAKRDFYKAVLDYNVSVAALFKATGWTLSDYLGSLQANREQAPADPAAPSEEGAPVKELDE